MSFIIAALSAPALCLSTSDPDVAPSLLVTSCPCELHRGNPDRTRLDVILTWLPFWAAVSRLHLGQQARHRDEPEWSARLASAAFDVDRATRMVCAQLGLPPDQARLEVLRSLTDSGLSLAQALDAAEILDQLRLPA